MSLSYFIRRLGSILVVLFGISLLTFLVVQLIPGDPARIVLGVQATPEAVEALRHQMGLDRPLPVQFAEWFTGVLRGDFGNSLITNQSILSIVAPRILPTVMLALAALLIGVVLALTLGITAALKPGSPRDLAVSGFAQLGVSIPDFWLGIMLIYLFAERWQWLPASGYQSLSTGVTEWASHLLLPAITAGVVSGAIMTRFVRSAMLEVLNQDYVRTAHAKGLTPARVTLRHALKNAAIPIVTIVGLQLATLLSQIVVVEIVFAWPGLGRLALEATLTRDYAILQAAVLLTAVIYSIASLVTDLLYGLLDPRVQYV